MKSPAHTVAVCALTGAAYAALTLLLSPISYGMIQLRLSELLCVLPYFIPCTAWGLFAGCILANLFTGNIFDIVFGSLATLIAGLIIAWIGRHRRGLLSELMACTVNVLINSIVVAIIITCAYNGKSILHEPGIFAMNMLFIFLGEAAVMYLLAFPLMRALPEKKLLKELISKYTSQYK